MTTLAPALAATGVPPFARPTRLERAVLVTARAAERFAIDRMQRRARTSAAAGPSVDDARRTAQALGSLGMLPQ